MKNCKIFALILTLIMLISALSVISFAETGKPTADYDNYGYYVAYDFENYVSGAHHYSYIKNRDSKNANGLLCDPYSFVLHTSGTESGSGVAVKDENGNTFYRHTTNGKADYNALAVLGLTDANGKSYIIGDAVEVSFRFRPDPSSTTTAKIALVNTRRNGGNMGHLKADIYGNLYAPVNGADNTLIYKNGDGKTVGGTGKFMDIKFVWYDVTNTFSVFVDGKPIVEAMPLWNNYRSTDYVTHVFDDDFRVAERKDKTVGRSLELLRFDETNTDVKFVYDVDDVVVKRYETAQNGTIYFEDTFEGAFEGMSNPAKNRSNAYIFSGDTSKITMGTDNVTGNRFLNVASGQTVGLDDRYYQQFLNDNIVIDFKIKGTVTHTSGYKSLVRFYDNNGVNMYKLLWADQNGYLYIDENSATKIEGVRLDGKEWIDVSIVGIRNLDKGGKFSSFSSSTTGSKTATDTEYYFNFYVNGSFVGTLDAKRVVKYATGGVRRTTSMFKWTITDYNTTLDLTGLILVDDTTTANHKIYKSADGLNYYDVTFENGVQTAKYSHMVLNTQVGNEEETLRFLTDATFNAQLDDIRVYEGTAPMWAYENANSSVGGNVVNVDFSNVVFSTNTGINSKTGSGANVLGTFRSAGVGPSNLTRNTDGYSTVKFNSGNFFDLYIPMPERVDGVYDFEYSYETVVKNINFGDNSIIKLFANRFESNSGSHTTWMMSLDKSGNLYCGDTAGKSSAIGLYNANGTPAKIDNANWNKLRVDVDFYDDGISTSLKFSYYLNDQLLYLKDGTTAYRMTSTVMAPSDLVQHFGGSNYLVRYTQNDKAFTMDMKSITVSAKSSQVYSDAEGKFDSVNGKISVIEFDIPAYIPTEGFDSYIAVSLVKKLGIDEHTLPLVLVDPVKKELSIGVSGVYYTLRNTNGKAYKLGDSPVKFAVVYDDINGTARYYIDDVIAYVNITGEISEASNIGIYSYDFTQVGAGATTGYTIFAGYGSDEALMDASDYNITSYSINNRDTAELVGFQENDLTEGIRFIAGVDSLYYSGVGFEMETFIDDISMGAKDISDKFVFESIIANDETIKATDKGYKYFAIGKITDLPKTFDDNSYIMIRSYTIVGDEKNYDDEMKLVVSNNGYYLTKDGVLYENNFNDITELPSEWKYILGDTATGSITVNEDGKVFVDNPDALRYCLYLDRSVGYEYVVQADLTIKEINTNNSPEISLLFGFTDPANFSYAYLKNDGYGKLQTNTGGKWSNTAKESVYDFPNLAIGSTYTLKLICTDGENVSFFVNGEFASSGRLTAGYNKEGKVGISVRGMDVLIDNVIITPIEDMYVENFDDASALDDWYRHEKACRDVTSGFAMSVKDGALEILDELGTLTFVALNKDFEYDNYVYEATFTMTTKYNGTGTVYMGPAFGIQETGEVVLVDKYISDDGKDKRFYIEAWYTNSASTKWKNYSKVESIASSVNTAHKFKLIMNEGRMIAYLNDAKITDVAIDEMFLSGQFGIVFRNAKIKVDDIRIYKFSDNYEIAEAPGANPRIKVSTFNIGDFSTATESASGGSIANGFGTEKTKAEYISFLNKVDADVWGLQEDSKFFSAITEETVQSAVYDSVLPYYQRVFTGTYNGLAFLSDYELYEVTKHDYPAVVTSYAPMGTTAYDHPWFLSGKIDVEGKEVTLITLHYDWKCKERRAQQIASVLEFATQQDYCIILGDFNPENYIDNSAIDGGANIYEEEWAIFESAGFEAANGGRFGVFGTLMRNGAVRNVKPWDNIFVSSNVKILSAEPVYASWMNDHSAVAAYLELLPEAAVYNYAPEEPAILDSGLDSIVGLSTIESSTIGASEDTYVHRGDKNASVTLGSEKVLMVKGTSRRFNILAGYESLTGSGDDPHRRAFIRFDISGLNVDDMDYVYLTLNCTAMQDSKISTPLYIREFDNSWSEGSTTYNTTKKQKGGADIASTVVSGTGKVTINITDYVKNCVSNGKNEISLILEGATENSGIYKLTFASKESGNGPALKIIKSERDYTTALDYTYENPWEVAMTSVNDWLDKWEAIKANGTNDAEIITKLNEEYATKVSATLNVDADTPSNTKYTSYNTRLVSSLKGYTASTAEVDLYDEYGGYTGGDKYEATGFFYTKKVGDRWWVIDPKGYPVYRTACVELSIGSSPNQEALMREKYGSSAAWAQAATDRMWELGFNATGGWSDTSKLISTDAPLAQTSIISTMSKYAKGMGLNVSDSGSTELVDGVIPVFDPMFDIVADLIIKESVKNYVDSPYIYGWMSDNELPDSLDMLDKALALDFSDERFVYSYATAWTFMYRKCGNNENVTRDMITDELRREYRAMVYDKYFEVVTSKFEKYDPNHMYLGCRFLTNNYKDEYVMRVAGYYCDIVTFNYYGVWEPEAEFIANAQNWLNAPFVITEWYAKGMDACTEENGLTNESGAGWTVKTQAERGMFYQNYALQLLECKGCVGFDWFKYWDNDSTNTEADLSNRDSNKGILDNNGDEYTDLTKYMGELNNQKYSLINFFDERNAAN